MSDINSGNGQPEKQGNADVSGGAADNLIESEPLQAPEASAPSASAPAEGGAAAPSEVSWADDGGAMGDVTEVVAAETPVGSGAADVTEVVAAEATTVFPSEPPPASAPEVAATSVDSTPPTVPATGTAGTAAATGTAAAAGAAAAAGTAPGWAAAPPPPPNPAAAPPPPPNPAAPPPPPPSYQATAPAAQPGYQAAPPPAYPTAPAAASAGTYGTATPYQPGPQTSNKAVVAMVMAILSFVVCPVILAVAALIVGGQAKQEIAASNGWLTGDGLVTGAKVLAWVNIALSVIGVIFMIIFFVALGNSLNDLQVNIDPSSGLGT